MIFKLSDVQLVIDCICALGGSSGMVYINVCWRQKWSNSQLHRLSKGLHVQSTDQYCKTRTKKKSHDISHFKNISLAIL